jgi:hypothetical protein
MALRRSPSPETTSSSREPLHTHARQDPPPSRSINLVIDSEGHGTFHIATKGLNNTNTTSSNIFESKSSKKSSSQTQYLTFDIQIDESSQRYLIHTSMGRLDKIRTIHPGMNILRTLSYWNGLQKRRYGLNPTEVVKGGQLGIVSKNRTDLVMMTLMGEYSHRAWEYDEVFQRELERFGEDALQFHLCLNGDGGGGGGKGEEAYGSPATFTGGTTSKSVTLMLGSIAGGGANNTARQQASASGDDTTAPSSTTTKRGRSKLLDKVFQKVIRD